MYIYMGYIYVYIYMMFVAMCFDQYTRNGSNSPFIQFIELFGDLPMAVLDHDPALQAGLESGREGHDLLSDFDKKGDRI